MLTQSRASDVELELGKEVSSQPTVVPSKYSAMSEVNSSRTGLASRIGLRFDEMLRRRVYELLASIEHGVLHLIDENGNRQTFGSAGPGEPVAELTVHDGQVWRDVALRGSIGAAEAYADGRWSSTDLVAVVRVMARNTGLTDQMERGFARLFTLVAKFDHRSRRNTRSGSKKNIHAHYDLGNEFFSLFLDPKMMYSSAVFPQPDADLDTASTYKLQRICRKLDLGPENHLLEIGSGWGGMAVYAAQNYGCRVTTATISRRQFAYVQDLVRERGLDRQVEVVLEDYRNLTGEYDRLVSVEMIEAVGHEYLGQYFDVCQRLLSRDGRMLLQGITLPDDRYEVSRHGVDFIQKYIFPGGGLPSLSVVLDRIARQGQLRMIHFEDLAGHYAQTLSHWRTRFHARRSHIAELGFSDEFFRLWDYYFAYCEGGFFERSIGLGQMLFVGPDVRDDYVDVDSLPLKPCTLT